jgi:hypothetical protein
MLFVGSPSIRTMTRKHGFSRSCDIQGLQIPCAVLACPVIIQLSTLLSWCMDALHAAVTEPLAFAARGACMTALTRLPLSLSQRVRWQRCTTILG